MADETKLTVSAPQPARAPNRRPLLVGAVLVLALLGLGFWRFGPTTGPGPLPTPTPNGPPPTPTPAGVVVLVPSPTVVAQVATPVEQDTPTPLAGAATFTPVPGQALTGPRVLGITAGVGMHPGDVAGAAQIAVTFSEAMDQASAQAAFAVQPAVPGAFRWQQNTLFFVPSAPLAPNTSYTVQVGATAKTSGGKILSGPLAASFKTAPPPAILRTLPTTGASEVPTDTIATITFNRPMIPLTALDNQPDPSAWITISPAVEGRWVWLGTAAVGFHASTGFLPATDYTIAVKAGWPDSDGVTLSQGTSFAFTTIKPAIESVSPPNGVSDMPIDTPFVVRFNMAMDRGSVQQAFTPHVAARNAALPGTYAWSLDSTVMTFTPSSLLEFSQDYAVVVGGPVKPAVGNAAPLAGTDNFWQFSTTDQTHVTSHNPDSDNGPAQPSDSFGFSFNNPLAPGQDVAAFLTVSPAPDGYKNQLDLEGSSVFTGSVRLLPNTTYSFNLKDGLKDKWGFPVQPASWQVKIGPLPPSLTLDGGSFQPIYSGGSTRVRIETANLDHLTLHLYTLTEDDMRKQVQPDAPYSPDTYPGRLAREWDVPVQADANGQATVYPALAVSAAAQRLPAGYYFLRVTAPTPYSPDLLQGRTILVVGHPGLVAKSDGANLFIWAADLGTGRPVANYPLRAEVWQSDKQTGTQRGSTDADGVLRLKLDNAAYDRVIIWGESQGDTALLSDSWGANIEPGAYGGSANTTLRGALYTDRPIYRPSQVVYFRGVYRADDDAHYSLPPAGSPVHLTARTYGNDGETVVYTGTTTLSQAGTFSGQFTLPANAPVGSYTLADNGVTSASFDVQEYRKPDFQVNVTGASGVVHGDPVTATIQTSYYFGGPLAGVTTTVNLQASPYYYYWSDPNTGESYVFGEGGSPWIFDYYGPGRPPTPAAPVQSFQATTDKDGLLTVDVSSYVTTTDSSKTVLIEGQVQDLSNQAIAANTSVVVHQGLYYVGLHVGDYIATAKQPTTMTVRVVAPDPAAPGGGRVLPNTSVNLRVVREEWTAPPYGSNEDWKLTQVPVDQATVTTDAQGRAVWRFTPQSGGSYRLIAESTDSRGNLVHSSTTFWATSSDPGYIPWRYDNDQQVKLVADKTTYKVGDTAHILVTSPYTQATALLTIERGHLKRYRVITLQGSAPSIDVPLEDGDLPNVYVGLTLLGQDRLPDGAPADWANHVTLRQGYVNLSLDTSGQELQVSVAPQGQGPFLPGSTAQVRVQTTDKNGKPVSGELSLGVVDEAIYALAGENAASLFDTFWSERSLGVRTTSSFSSGDSQPSFRAIGGGLAGGIAMPAAAPAATESAAARDSTANGAAAPAAPQKVRSNFQDTAFWSGSVTTGPDGSAVVPVPLPDNLTTWRLTVSGITAATLAGKASAPLTVTQPLLLRPVQPRFLLTGDNPHPQAIVHNNTGSAQQIVASLEVSGALTLDAQPAATQTLTVAPGTDAVVTWSAKVSQGDVANLRYWVYTAGVAQGQPGYYEDAVAAHLPVEPFAAPEAVATSGEVAGTRTDESVFVPYSVSPVLGELIVQVSPSLAAATTESINYVKEYPYESTDQTVSRFLPLVVLEQVYNEQGLKTPYAAELPGIVASALQRLGDLQQPDGGWAWWERGPSNWWETAYAVQGLTAARDAGYAVPGSMLQRGIQALQGFLQGNATEGLDETYHLNMRAYTLYVLSQAVGTQDDQLRTEGQALVGQAARLSNHARAWLAMGLAKIGMQTESKGILDSLAAAARQTSTTAHWEEGSPDYWSMGTDNRATALAIDALVTLDPGDPLVPKAVRWLMNAEKEGHWLSSQETSISLISLAHYIRQSKELTANYTWQVSLAGQLLGEGAANSYTLTQTTTLRAPVSGIPQNTLTDLALARSDPSGKMYYQVSLRYYVPGENIRARSEGLAIARTYYAMPGGATGAAGDSPIKEAKAGDLVKVRLTIVTTDTVYYALVTDPLPAGLEGVNGSLNTTSFTERPPAPAGFNAGGPKGAAGYYDPWFWRWGPFDNVEMRDDRTVLFAGYLSPGTYVYEYFARATTPGVYLALPARVELSGYPDVFGHSDGGTFTVK